MNVSNICLIINKISSRSFPSLVIILWTTKPKQKVNNISDEPVSEIYVVITQPDGKVLKTDVWDAFSIDTRKEGKKSYTRKVRFDYERGENKKLLFFPQC